MYSTVPNACWCARGCQKLGKFVFLKLESCNLVNTYVRRSRAGCVKNISTMDLPRFCILGEILVKILLESLKRRTLLVMFCVLKFYFVDFYGMFTSSPTWHLKMYVLCKVRKNIIFQNITTKVLKT